MAWQNGIKNPKDSRRKAENTAGKDRQTMKGEVNLYEETGKFDTGDHDDRSGGSGVCGWRCAD